MSNSALIIVLAVVTLVIAVGFAMWQRGRNQRAKETGERSSFTRDHGDPPRPNRPGT